MRLPAFFDEVPRLRVHDPLAEALGCADGGLLEYGYADVVRLTGHSCPTVAAAYWLTWLSLHHLYGDAPPERGGVMVELREAWGELGRRWQRRVKALLLDLAHDPGVFVVRRVERRQMRQAPPAALSQADFIPRR